MSLSPWPQRSSVANVVDGCVARNAVISGSRPSAGVWTPWMRRTLLGTLEGWVEAGVASGGKT